LDGQSFYTLLYREDAGFRREDLSESAYGARDASGPKPFSLWRSKFEKPAEKPPEAIERASAEEMLRRYMEQDGQGFANVRYILAVMLERKRQLKEVETRRTESGLVRVYTHGKTEVMDLLTAGRPSVPATVEAGSGTSGPRVSADSDTGSVAEGSDAVRSQEGEVAVGDAVEFSASNAASDAGASEAVPAEEGLDDGAAT
jgi:hypothetical protein